MDGQFEEKTNDAPFWERKTLEEMSREEWESLCDGCAKCCLNKLESDRTGEVYYTDVACKLLNSRTCRCLSYENRRQLVPGCAILTPGNVRRFHWLPETCAYGRLARGKDLYKWHYLISGKPDLVHKLGISVKNRVISETDIHQNELPLHVVDWK